MSKAFFITGTDTEVGKTTIAAGFMHAARKRGLSTAAIKPVASGCEMTTEGWRNSDALILWRECSVPLTYDQVNPIALEPAIAPHLAAQEANTSLNTAILLPPIRQVLAMHADLTVIEGAGGWPVPLHGNECLSDVAIALQLPVILVVGVRLGCINHALLTAEAIQRDGLTLAGWVANVMDNQTDRIEENLNTLTARLPAPCLGQVRPVLPVSAQAIANCLDLTLLGM